ncbi:3-hydroxyacyl-CoA dehydrogenase family protein [Microbacterium sp.]|uniref:3-hydroxyacyl-CoA dehydrogenase family protein n=1 Tax=Microbacterium sp. TaxID=51671 RepID=UPI0035C7798E
MIHSSSGSAHGRPDTSATAMTNAGRPAPARVGVLGGGRMGAGIAHAFLLAGSRVAVVERDSGAAEAASGRIAETVGRSVERDAALDASEIIGRLSCGVDFASFEACDLVIEAVPEDRTLKTSALQSAEAAMTETAVLASNTSSISIDDLASVLTRPDRFLGLHFFNPVPASLLVEIVRGTATDAAVVDDAQGHVRALGKAPIVVKDSPGFASSRLGVMLGLEAIRMLEEGVASAEDIDAAMTLGYRHPLGPLRTTDIVGLDVRLGIAEELASALGPRFEAPALLRTMVAEGRLGRKSGEGFYNWSSAPAENGGRS